jgi:uracil-DNA glycosylase
MDRSGATLRAWLGVDQQMFYDPDCFAIMPMGFCYPGKGSAGDLAPRPECAPLWHDSLLEWLPDVALRVFIGQHPLARYFSGAFESLTDAARNFKSLLPDRIVLPHPSPRNGMWLARNPWFEKEVVPTLQQTVAAALKARR